MNNKRTIERIATITLAAFLIAYFCYQVAYGIETTLWPNGTRTFGNLPPGSTITNVTGNAYIIDKILHWQFRRHYVSHIH